MKLTPSVVLFAASAAADIVAMPGHMAIREAIEARQTSLPSGLPTGIPDCATKILSVVASAPTPPPEYIAWAASNPPKDPCSITVPPNLAPAYSSYTSKASAWYAVNSAALDSALKSCPEFASSGAPGPDTCGTSGGNGAPPAGGNGNGGGNGAKPSGTSGTPAPAGTNKPNGATRQTGLGASAIAAVGILGAVALL